MTINLVKFRETNTERHRRFMTPSGMKTAAGEAHYLKAWPTVRLARLVASEVGWLMTTVCERATKRDRRNSTKFAGEAIAGAFVYLDLLSARYGIAYDYADTDLLRDFATACLAHRTDTVESVVDRCYTLAANIVTDIAADRSDLEGKIVMLREALVSASVAWGVSFTDVLRERFNSTSKRNNCDLVI